MSSSSSIPSKSVSLVGNGGTITSHGALKCQQISNGISFFYTMTEKDVRYWFLTCVRVNKPCRLCLLENNCHFSMGLLPSPSYKVGFKYVKYWGLCYNWSVWNGFLFDDLHRVPQHVHWFKRKLIWLFSQPSSKGILSLEELTLCHIVQHHVRDFMSDPCCMIQ